MTLPMPGPRGEPTPTGACRREPHRRTRFRRKRLGLRADAAGDRGPQPVAARSPAGRSAGSARSSPPTRPPAPGRCRSRSPTSPGRSGLRPAAVARLRLGRGNGPFGFGWALSLPAVTRRTDKGLPRYDDVRRVPALRRRGPGAGARARTPDGLGAGQLDRPAARARATAIDRYRPRVEGLFARIERWTRLADGDTHWRSVTRDNVANWYGQDANSRVADPADPTRVFSWLLCRSEDDRGNAISYEYLAENGDGVDLAQAHERHRGPAEPHRQPVPQADPVRQPDLRLGRSRPAGPGLDVRGGVRLRRARPGRRPPRRRGAAAAVPGRPVLLLPRRLRGAHLPAVPAGADVPPLPGRAGRRRGLPGPLDRLRLHAGRARSARSSPR